MNIISVEVPSGIDATTCLLCRASVKISKFFHHLQNVHDVLFDHEFILKVNLIGRKKIEALLGNSDKLNPNNNSKNESKGTIKYSHFSVGNDSAKEVKPFSLEETIFDLEMDEPSSSEKPKFDRKYDDPKAIDNDVMTNEDHSENFIPERLKLEPDEAQVDSTSDNLFKSEESISTDDSYRSLRTCYTCSNGKTFQSKYHLKRHEKTHTREKLANSMPSPSSIKSEESISRDSTRPLLTCSMYSTGKLLKSRYHLQRHEDLHTGEKPFFCENCSQSFSRRDHLKRHNKRFH